jgi:vacuolar-type H+-ATPase subunit H
MIRHIGPVTWALVVSASLLACDKPGATEQQREQRANEQVTQAANEANQQTQSAQAAADKDIAAARTDFEKSREDYRHARTKDLSDVDEKIANLESKATTATGKTKARLDANPPPLRAQREAFVRDIQTLDRATAATWDETKANVDREWDALKAAVDKAE